MTSEQEKEVREAVRHLLEKEHIGDFIYTVREREGAGWEGPRVTAYQKAIDTLREFARGGGQ